ncbi:MAG: oxygen-independent coproporphyrinogen III oxidase [Proteobacteria bacterium]|nr:oxygen-independent coproporphyrinogen III oxidase [Pseudomonadota bacterium]
MTRELIHRYGGPVPRYTSYPTANHFTPEVTVEDYRAWLSAVPNGEPLSVYVHIPFCQEMCWYCGCSTKAVHRYEPISDYMKPLMAEFANVAALLPAGHEVTHVHWGGGSPNMLSAIDIGRLAAAIRARLNIGAVAEFAVEVDPRGVTDDRVAAFADAGVNRVSIGVQDFNEDVQKAINRVQPFDLTRRVIEKFRDHGVNGINVDLVYGLPHQTRRSVEETIRQVLALAPDRIATFGYAHLPARIRHQRLIEDKALPDAIERFGQSNRLARILEAEGYIRIGLDHFARAHDSLTKGAVRRNFQGYTTDTAEHLIGFGASSIGSLSQGYVQNAVAVADYARRIAEAGLATVRGARLTDDDRARRFAIESLMCDFNLPAAELRRRFGDAAAPVLADAEALAAADPDHLIERCETGFSLTTRGKPFVRTIASCFDSYLDSAKGLHSASV